MSTSSPATPTSGIPASLKEKAPWGLLVVILTSTFMQLLDATIVNVASPSIQATLHSSFGAVQLVFSAYQLGFACSLILASRLGDVYGRRRLFLIGMAGFTVSSLLCGLAPTVEFLVAARFTQGLTSALMFSQVLAMIQVLFTGKNRGIALGGYGTTVGLGSIMGLLVGGILVQAHLTTDSWRSIFLVNLPIGIAAFVFAYLRMPETKSDRKPTLDFGGAVLTALSLGLIIYPLAEGRTYGWPAWSFITLAIGLALVPVLVWYENRIAKKGETPILDIRLFADAAFREGALMNFVFYMGIPTFFFTFSLYLQIGQSFDALHAGLTTLPFAVLAAIVSRQSGQIAQKLGNRILELGSLIIAASMIVLIVSVMLAGNTPNTWDFFIGNALGGIGFGLFVPPVIGLVLANVKKQNAGAASGALATSQQVGGAIGVALIGLLYFGTISSFAPTAVEHTNTVLSAQLKTAGMPAMAIKPAIAKFDDCFVKQSKSVDPTQVPAGCAQPTNVPKAISAAFQKAVTDAKSQNFGHTMSISLWFQVVVFLLAFVMAFMLRRLSLHNHHED